MNYSISRGRWNVNRKARRRGGFRAAALALFIFLLTLAATRPRADTGTCNGVTITLPFTDVQGNPFLCAIAEAFFTGLTFGTTPTTYSPSQNVPREQMAAFITRTLDQSLRRGSRRAALGQWWTPQNQNGMRVTDVPTAPISVACDGADLWVACIECGAAPGCVRRVRASDGRVLGSEFGASVPYGVVIAAGQVYVTESTHPGEIYRIDPRVGDGGIGGTFVSDLGGAPRGITFDGVNLWTANLSGSISRVNIATRGVTSFTTGFNAPVGILYDGTDLWVTDQQSHSLKRVNALGAVTQTIPVGLSPRFLVFDGTNLWVPSHGSDSVAVVRASTGAVLQTLTGNGLNGPQAAAFDGERILVTNNLGHSVSLWKAADLTPLGSASTGAGTQPQGACSDGLNFWIVLTNTNQLARF